MNNDVNFLLEESIAIILNINKNIPDSVNVVDINSPLSMMDIGTFFTSRLT